MNIGDYVRTKYGDIGKIIKIEGKNYYFNWDIDQHQDQDSNTNLLFKNELEGCKSSPNIIDLVEVGDILSFKDGSICRVLEIADGYYLLKDYSDIDYYEKKEWIKDFNSIVTKEQFEEKEYKI